MHHLEYFVLFILPEVTRRLKVMPPVRDPQQRCLHTRQFNNGIANISVFTADDMMALLQHLPYVVGANSTAVIKDQQCANAFSAGAFTALRILSTLKARTVTENDLQLMSDRVSVIGGYLRDMQVALDDKDNINTSVPKVHALLHLPYVNSLWVVGCLFYLSTATTKQGFY